MVPEGLFVLAGDTQRWSFQQPDRPHMAFLAEQREKTDLEDHLMGHEPSKDFFYGLGQALPSSSMAMQPHHSHQLHHPINDNILLHNVGDADHFMKEAEDLF